MVVLEKYLLIDSFLYFDGCTGIFSKYRVTPRMSRKEIRDLYSICGLLSHLFVNFVEPITKESRNLPKDELYLSVYSILNSIWTSVFNYLLYNFEKRYTTRKVV